MSTSDALHSNLTSAVHTSESQTLCKPCQTVFDTWGEYESHMLNSEAHKFCCEICVIDLRSYGAYRKHRELMHPLNQDLKCQTCGQTFLRYASLVGHLESSKCRSGTKSQLASVRKKKLQAYDSQKAARNFRDFNRNQSRDVFADEPLPMSLSINRENRAGNVATLADQSSDEELISFTGRSAAWKLRHNLENDFSLPNLSESHTNNTKTAPTMSPKITPSVPDKHENERATFSLDSYGPGVQIESFYIPLLMKYKCPHRGCGKTVKTRVGFINHMKSQAHQDYELQCRGCLRHFTNATALAQHCESQSRRCRIRELDDYEQVVDIMTAGTVTVAGRLPDNSLAYATK